MSHCPACHADLSDAERHRGYCQGCDTDLPTRFKVEPQQRDGAERFAVLDTERNGLPYLYRSDIEAAYDEDLPVKVYAEGGEGSVTGIGGAVALIGVDRYEDALCIVPERELRVAP